MTCYNKACEGGLMSFQKYLSSWGSTAEREHIQTARMKEREEQKETCLQEKIFFLLQNNSILLTSMNVLYMHCLCAPSFKLHTSKSSAQHAVYCASRCRLVSHFDTRSFKDHTLTANALRRHVSQPWHLSLTHSQHEMSNPHSHRDIPPGQRSDRALDVPPIHTVILLRIERSHAFA